MNRKAILYNSAAFFVLGGILAPFSKSGFLIMGAIGLTILFLPIVTIIASIVLCFMKKPGKQLLVIGIFAWLLFVSGLVIGIFCHNKYINSIVLDSWHDGQTSFSVIPYGDFHQVVPPPAGTLAQYYSSNCWYFFTIIDTVEGPVLEYRD